MQSSFTIAGFILIGLLYGALGHSYLTTPISRSDQQQTVTGCRGPACLGPCDVPLASKTRAAIPTQRGALLNIQWPRNNHAGGFIRFSWAPTGDSDNMAAFDAGVQQINCHEIGGCAPSDPSNPNGGDTNGNSGLVNPCQTNIHVPTSLADGSWTLQWAWFGGAFSLGDYYSCADYQVSGGSALSSQSSAVFVGGDYTYPGQNKCKFFNTDRLHECIDEPCSNPIFPAQAEQSGTPFGFSKSASSSSSSSSSTSTSSTSSHAPASTSTSTSTSSPAPASTSTSTSTSSPAPAPAPLSTSTTGKGKGSSTGKKTSSTSTSASVTPASTSTSTSTSASVTPSSTSTSTSASVAPSSTSTSSPSSEACVTGNMKCLTSESYSTCAHNLWGVSQPCSLGTTCSPSGVYIYCV